MVCWGFKPGPQDGRRRRNHSITLSKPKCQVTHGPQWQVIGAMTFTSTIFWRTVLSIKALTNPP